MPVNEFGQPVGPSLGAWTPPSAAPTRTLAGDWATVRRWTSTDAEPLLAGFRRSADDLWTYMPWGPFQSPDGLAQVYDGLSASQTAVPFTILVDGVPQGVAAYLRIALRDGAIEIGSITYSSALQRTAAATEAMSMMIDAAFDAGFRRVEWKCDDLNAPSRRAAERLGFVFEGTFRNATHYKGRSRDTAWFAITADDWPPVRTRHAAWLDPANFDESGDQRTRLATDIG
ncbi:MAG: GNAT family N-acetyltransferase [Ilumatobacter sp.]